MKGIGALCLRARLRNHFDPWAFAELNDLLDQAEKDKGLQVIFESDDKVWLSG